MKIREYSIWTFMTWNESSADETTRAIALCHPSGYFCCAINTQRDVMGRKDENGVYERKWWNDYALTEENYRPATNQEVALYLRYVNWQDAVGEDYKVRCVITGDCTQVLLEERRPSLWYRIRCLWNYLKARLWGYDIPEDNLPF